MVAGELGIIAETETRDELLVLDLFRLLSNKRFFGGRLGGENFFTEEMNAYLRYCQEIGTAVVSSEGIDYPMDMGIFSSRGIIYGLGVPGRFTDCVRADPEVQTGFLVVAAVTQRNKIMAVNNQWTEDRYDLVAQCDDHFHRAAWKISKHYFGFGDFLAKHLKAQLV